MATALIPSQGSFEVQVSDDNPFSALSKQQRHTSVMESAVNTEELGRIQAKIFLAKQFPRDPAQAFERIKIACGRPELASNAIYEYTRGGTKISGPSIRLAEEIVRCWINIDSGFCVLDQTATRSTVRAYAIDYENNITKEIVFIVPHYRETKQAKKLLTSDRDIYELVANQASRRVRNCIISLIPADVIDMAVQTCEQTMLAKCDMSPAAIKKLVDSFAMYNVSKEQIEVKIQRKIEAISPGQVVQFRKIYASLKDGMSTPADWFDMTLANTEETPDSQQGQQTTNTKAEAIKEKFRKGATSPEPKQQGAESKGEPEKPEAKQEVKPEPKPVPKQQDTVQQKDPEPQPRQAGDFSDYYVTTIQTIATTKISSRLQGMVVNVKKAKESGEITEHEAQLLFTAIDNRHEQLTKPF